MQAEVVLQELLELLDAGQCDLQASLFHHIEALEPDVVVGFAAFANIFDLAAQAVR